MKTLNKSIKTLFSVVLSLMWLTLLLAVVTVVVWKIGNFMGLFESFPKGLDAYAYLFKIEFVSTYFPHVFWNPFWDSGVPTFTWSYPPLSAFLGSFLHLLFGLSYEASLTSLAFLAMTLLGIGVYGIIFEATGIRILGFFIISLLFSLGGIWSWWADGGNYPRVLGMGFWAISIFLLLKYVRLHNKAKRSKLWWFATVLAFHLSLTTHLLTGGLTLLIGFFLILVISKNRINDFFGVIAVSLLTASYWFLPMFLTGHKAGSFFGAGVNQGAVPFQSLLSLNKIQPFYSWPDRFALAVAASALLVVFGVIINLFLPKLKIGWTAKIGLIFTLVLGCLVFYEVANLFPWYPKNLFIDGLPALSAFFLTSFFAVLVVGIGLGVFLNLIPSWWAKELASLFLIIPLFFFLPSFNRALSLAKDFVYDVGDKAGSQIRLEDMTPQPAFRQLLLGRERESNYRFGTDTAYVSDWWNWEYINYPQTKDYFAQGVTYPDWQFWMENAVWKEEGNYPETNFLLDWYGVKNFLVSIPNAKVRKFLSREEDYKKLSCAEIAAENSCEFEFNQAVPILTATNKPIILVVGNPENYGTLFRGWAKTGLGSKEVIWVKGPKSLDSVSASDLKVFSAVFLYGYNNSPSRLEAKLKKYVENGGGLLIEANRDKEEQTNLPDPYPVNQVEKEVLKGDWQFKEGQADLANQASWQDFSKPELDGGGWGVALAKNSKNWAKTVVYSNGKSLIVAGQMGKGRVVWSGVNLPFHLLTFKNNEETAFLAKLVLWTLAGDNKEGVLDNKTEFINPHTFAIQVDKPARGVLFKESYTVGWGAKAGNKNVKIWRAGPDLMYVDLASVKNFPVRVEFKYNLFPLEKISLLLSLFVFTLIFDYLLGGRILLRLKGIFRKIPLQVKTDKEKEENEY
ncbi:MAG: hypothetical protein Q8Q24_00135 [bacterium]|nr:hypothetical protein [bacterium]